MKSVFSFEVLCDGSLVLSVGGHCIQTAAKQAYREVTLALLEEAAASEELASVAETLERFLTATDFPALRAQHPELAGGRACRVRLHRLEDGSIGWSLAETAI